MSTEHIPTQQTPTTDGTIIAGASRRSAMIRDAGRAVRGPRAVTYGLVLKELGESLTADLLTKGKSLQRVSNSRTAVNGWMRGFTLSEESAVGEELGPDFSRHLDAHLARLESEGKSRNTLNDRKSILTRFRETWISILQSGPGLCPGGDFAEALDALMRDSDLPAYKIAERVGFTHPGLDRWCKGLSVPRRSSLTVVARLEDLFGIPYGALAAKLPRIMYGDGLILQTGQTGYREHLRRALGTGCNLKIVPPRLREELDTLVKFYTDAGWLRVHGMQRNSRWRVREHDQTCPTADLKERMLRKFFGYLCLPPDSDRPESGGKGFAADGLSLALLSDSALVYDYLQFKKERTYLKRHNRETLGVLELCSALLRPVTGFLWQSPEMGARLPDPVPEGEWRSWCERNRKVMRSLRKDLVREGEIKMSRDPFEPIRSIIANNQHPLDVLFELADAYEADLPPRNASARTRAFRYQFLLLIKFATLIPLRAFNFSVMTYRGDNTGNLYQKPDGSWWVRFDVAYFKNYLGAAKDHIFDVPIHPSLRPYVEEFLSVHRPHLMGAGGCDYLLRPRVCRPKNLTKPLNVPTLSLHVYKLTRQYIPDCPGFSMHAFRHLVATEYIKNNPAGYAVAAAVLHDREKTVRNSYAWVVPSDKFFCWNKYADALMKKPADAAAAA